MWRHVILWSAMRSGSTEFARDISRTYHLLDVHEPFNPRLHSSPRNLQVLSHAHTPCVFKVFPGHSQRKLPKHCAIVLERRNVNARWCSLRRARRSRDWSGRVRHNCTPRAPSWFVHAHQKWYVRLQRIPRHLYLTFEDVVFRRNESLRRVGTHCHK